MGARNGGFGHPGCLKPSRTIFLSLGNINFMSSAKLKEGNAAIRNHAIVFKGKKADSCFKTEKTTIYSQISKKISKM